MGSGNRQGQGYRVSSDSHEAGNNCIGGNGKWPGWLKPSEQEGTKYQVGPRGSMGHEIHGSRQVFDCHNFQENNLDRYLMAFFSLSHSFSPNISPSQILAF